MLPTSKKKEMEKPEIVQDIDFSYNWNGKLNCKSFTTIRLRNDMKYVVGERYRLKIKGERLGGVEILAIKHFYLRELNEFIARIDTGYSKDECEKIIRRMYSSVDFEKLQLSLILLRRLNDAD